MSKILISYRREDSDDVTGRIYDRLQQAFGGEAVFKDVDSIPLGVDFRTYLDEQVGKCQVFLAVIGKEWMGKMGPKGKSKLEDKMDFVRIEIESALKRQIPVIPLLVRGATIPKADRLPSSIQDLSYRNGIPVRSDPDFHRDMDRLIEQLKRHLSPTAHRAGHETQAVPYKSADFEKNPDNMVRIPKDSFLCGDDKTSVTINHEYWMDIYPVINAEYRKFIEAGGYANRDYWMEEGWKWRTKKKVRQPSHWRESKWNQPDHPVVGVSYYEADAYANWIAKRLPTEQEWEKAARGSDGRSYPWGEIFDRKKCNSAESGMGCTTPVAEYREGASPYGCYDMAGNVWEWTASWEKGKYVVLRGGSWLNQDENLKTSNRCWDYPPSYRNFNIGFRCALSPQ